MTVLLKETLKPNLVQTLEGQPAFVHCGPFANIAHGNSSLVADRIGLKLGDMVITESGFGADMGMEKFMDIVCRVGDLTPSAVVLVATVKALKHHGGNPDGGAEAIEAGSANLVRHLGTIREFGLKAVVAVNRFPADTDEELAQIRRIALEHGAFAAEANEAVAKGGAGATALAEAVVAATEEPSSFAPVYPLDDPIERKIEAIVDPCLRRRRDPPPAGRAQEDRGVRARRLRQAADLHGEDAPVALPRPDARERSDRLHRDGARHPRLYGRGLARRALRRHADDAGLRANARGAERRHRRQGPHGGPFLSRIEPC